MKEAAETFGKAHGVDMQVTAGPTGKWLDQAKGNADVIFSGSEGMMSNFVTAFGGQTDAKTVTPTSTRQLS